MDVEKRFSQEAMLFGRQVRKIRKFRNLTQPALSTKARITQPEISLIENAGSNFEFLTLIKLANGLSVHTLELFDYAKEDAFVKIKELSFDERFSDEKINFGKRVAQLIRNKETIQDDFAISKGFDPGDLSRFINGEHNIEFINIVKLAEALDTDLITLFAYNGIGLK